MTIEDRLSEIRSHLDCAIRQSLPSDDQIIMDHARAALEQAKTALAEIRAAKQLEQVSA